MARVEVGGKRRRRKGSSPSVIRASVSLPGDVYSTLEGIADSKKVSVAWVVREAVDKYIADQWPLLSGGKQEESQG